MQAKVRDNTVHSWGVRMFHLNCLPAVVRRLALSAVAACCMSAAAATMTGPTRLPRIEANPNLKPGGTATSQGLRIALELREGEWFPESDTGPSLKVFAFAEAGKAPQIPGPLLRAREGTVILASIRNLLDVDAVIHGLHRHPGKQEDVIRLAAGESREVEFEAGEPGAHYYWASAGGDTWNDRPYREDSQLSGAFIIDPAKGAAPDRVFLLGTWRDRRLPFESLDVTTINGKSWPHTERLTYTQGEPVLWHVLNPSNLQHPMHLHGSYFRVENMGDGERYEALVGEQQKLVATQLLPPGATMSVRWVPDRPGRWLFHCHILGHVTPDIMLLRQGASGGHPSHAASNHAEAMSGLVLGITVLPARKMTALPVALPHVRKLELQVASRNSSGPATLGYALREGGSTTSITSPGPPIVLVRGERVSIRVVNRLDEPTAVHWHGIELESYYDGVPGWTGMGRQVTPLILPGKSFVARFTPPRAGTFIYHTHVNDIAQMSSGLYGPIIILPPGERFDPERDRVFVIGHYGKRAEGGLLLNGSGAPPPLRLRAGTSYRLRFVNITANNVTAVKLRRDGTAVEWRPIAKDGADLPAAQANPVPALLTIAPGETYDFQFRPEQDGELEMTAEVVLLKELVRQTIQVEAADASGLIKSGAER